MLITEESARKRAIEYGMLEAYEEARRFGLSPAEALEEWDLLFYGEDEVEE